MQTKKNSLIESITNTISGFVISLLIQLLIYPIMGIPVNFSSKYNNYICIYDSINS